MFITKLGITSLPNTKQYALFYVISVPLLPKLPHKMDYIKMDH